MHARMFVCMYALCAHARMYAYTYAHVYVLCTVYYARTYSSVYVCVYVCVYIYTYGSFRFFFITERDRSSFEFFLK
jgi:hypothetical protein